MSAKNLTGEECARIAATIRDVMRQFKVDLSRTPLGADLAEADWMATFRGDVFYTTSLPPADRKRAAEAFPRVLRLKRIAWAMQTASSLKGFEGVVRHLRHLRVRFRAPHGAKEDTDGFGRSWDQLFEIELAAFLCGTNLIVEFAEPDLVIRAPEGDARLGVACKRPRSLKSLPGAVGGALRQATEFAGPAAVALSLDLMLPSHRGAAPNWVVVDHDRKTERECNALMGTATVQVAGALGRVFRDTEKRQPELAARVAGTLAIANVVVMAGIDGGKQYMNTKLLVNRVPLLGEPAADDFLALVRLSLLRGQEAFRRDDW